MILDNKEGRGDNERIVKIYELEKTVVWKAKKKKEKITVSNDLSKHLLPKKYCDLFLKLHIKIN